MERFLKHTPLPLWDTLPLPHPEAPFVPHIRAYPVKGSRAAVVIYPGGGYFQLSEVSEGSDIAEAYNERGFSAFVVKYRYKPSDGHAILADGHRGVQFARFHAAHLGFDPDKIAVCGFSAGGHLAMAVCEHEVEFADGAIGRESAHPNACILGYPVVTLGDGTFPTMPEIFLGDKKDDAVSIASYSYPYRLDRMPPTFSFYSKNDTAVDYNKNAEAITGSLRGIGTYAECHAFSDAAHGTGLGKAFPDFSQWFELSVAFLNKVFGL